MGRRALPKLDPCVDYSRILMSLKDFPARSSLDELFGRSAELEIEVGSGKGLFLVNAARQFPERDFLGNEISIKYARLCAYRLTRHGCSNARVVHGDGLALFRDHLADRIAAGVHVYFPDPWWKKRHRKRRVMQPSFVSDIYRVLKPGGILHFWTDVDEYFQTTCELIRETAPLQGPHSVGEPLAAHDMDYRTHFERRMRRLDQPVFRCQFIRPLD